MANELVTSTELEKRLEQDVSTVEAQASAIVIRTDDDLKFAKDFVAGIKKVTQNVENYWKPLWDASYKTYKTVMDRKKAMLTPLANAEKTVKKEISKYVDEQERKAREEAERLRRLAQEEMERKLNEAAKAESEGDAVGAEYAMAEAEAYESASLSNPSVVATPKVDGMQKRKTWVLKSVDLSKLPCEYAGVMLRPADEKAIMNLVRATKGQIQIPGVTYEETYTIAVRAS